MKRIPALLCLALSLTAPSFAQAVNGTVGELLRALREQPSNQASWTVIPIAGSDTGAKGSVFHTDLALTGNHAYYFPARIAVAWLPVGRDASADAVRYMDLPGEFDVAFTLFHDGLGNDGLGALVIAAVDAQGELDPQGKVVATVRIWSASACAGETSLAYRPIRWLGADRGAVIGLTLGQDFRSNAGIVNADAIARTWRIHYASLADGSSVDFEVTVPAASSAIVGLPPFVLGPISLTIEAETAGLLWTGWGASVDNESGDAWYSAITPF